MPRLYIQSNLSAFRNKMHHIMSSARILATVLLLALAANAAILEAVEPVETETTEYGPITVVLDNLAQIAVNVSDETSAQLQTRIDRTVLDMAGHIEVLTANALEQLSNALYETNQLLSDNPSCNAAWNLEQFTANVTDQLGDCTLTLNNMIEVFRQEGQQLLTDVQSFVQEIIELPTLCQLPSFGGGANCFLRSITGINQKMSRTLNDISLLLMRTRQMSQRQVEQAQDCNNGVVTQVGAYLSQERDNCE